MDEKVVHNKVLQFRPGQEGSEIVEHSGLENSIFSDQYERALSLINNYLSPESSNSGQLNVVAFCGERGEGKTSCMLTVMDILNHTDRDAAKPILDSQTALSQLHRSRLAVLPLIDPAFFDKWHNVAELVLGQMYLEVTRRASRDTYGENCALYEAFEKAKRSIDNIRHNSSGEWDELQAISDLAAGMELRECLRDLVRLYLRQKGTDALVVAIDDIDLNMGHAYEMCEHIRKYLSFPECIVLISVRLNQLRQVVEESMHQNINGYETIKQDLPSMAKNYVEKLIPLRCRVAMPGGSEISRWSISLSDNGDGNGSPQPLASAVLTLIGQKTGYRFSARRGEYSSLLPTNLRQLVQLLGLLVSMPDPSDSELLVRNRDAFKNYFFEEWTARLTAEGQESIKELVAERSLTAINKAAVSILGVPIGNSPYGERDFTPDEGDSADDYLKEIFAEITDPANFSYNVSVGDVFHLIGMLSCDTECRTDADILFFIKSFYTILLTDLSDRPPSDNGTRGSENERDGAIMHGEALLKEATDLQLVVGAGYFTLYPGEILPMERQSNTAFDMAIIGIFPLWKLLTKLKAEYDASEGTNEGFWRLFNLAEYIVLSIVCPVPLSQAPNPVAALDRMRKRLDPLYLVPVIQRHKHGVFNVLGILGRRINPESAYRRFERAFPGFYDVAKSSKKSLLTQICSAPAISRPIESGEEIQIISEKLRLGKGLAKVAAGPRSISHLYRKLALEHPTSCGFLDVVSMQVTDNIGKKEESVDELSQIFWEMFNEQARTLQEGLSRDAETIGKILGKTRTLAGIQKKLASAYPGLQVSIEKLAGWAGVDAKTKSPIKPQEYSRIIAMLTNK